MPKGSAQTERRKKRSPLFWIAVVVGTIVLLFIVVSFLMGLFSPSTNGQSLGVRIPDAGREHISLGETHAPYTSVPPTSGAHFGQPLAPTQWGIYEEQIQDEVLIHNLEHGGIGVFYDCPDGCDEIVRQLSVLVDRGTSANLKIVLSPYAGMDSRISLAAWTFLDQFEEYDEDRIRAFVDAHESSDSSPEPFAQ